MEIRECFENTINIMIIQYKIRFTELNNFELNHLIKNEIISEPNIGTKVSITTENKKNILSFPEYPLISIRYFSLKDYFFLGPMCMMS